jgi:hypothetical protein
VYKISTSSTVQQDHFLNRDPSTAQVIHDSPIFSILLASGKISLIGIISLILQDAVSSTEHLTFESTKRTFSQIPCAIN